MTTEQIFDKVKAIIVDTLGCDEEAVTMQARMGDDLGADSLDDVEMVMKAEHEFGIVIPDDQIVFKGSTTVQECCYELVKIINQ